MGETRIEWGRVKALFMQAQERPSSEREQWLVAECADDQAMLEEVRSLLRESEAGDDGFLSAGAERIARTLIATPSDTSSAQIAVGDSVGPYRILRMLGEGGMGRVFLAARDDGQFRQQVALKLVRAEFATQDLRDRFLRERDILARLAHPNIAQLHDGGVAANGAPYFTLEYIDGEPVTRRCDALKLDVAARLRLMLKICDAVQYAHRNLVVHRDIKPSNILVTAEGEPKLLDFGIAKPLDPKLGPDLTGIEARPMTREYAAPEQVLGDTITTATDVYSLGVLLYELLCGRLPYARAARGESSWPKAIVEETPEPLSRAVSRAGAEHAAQDVADARSVGPAVLQRRLRGDLDRIVSRALEKAPESRYPSVATFAEDIRAHLEGRALPGGNRRYRLWKFVRRNRLAVGFGIVLLSVVIASLSVIALQARRVAANAQEALRQAQTTAAVKDFLLDLFHKADPNVAKGKELTARDLVDRGTQRIDKLPPEQAALKAELQVTLGTIYFQLGLNKPAAELHETAFNSLKTIGGDPALTAMAERDWATELVHLNKISQARELADDAVQRLRAMPHPPVADLVRSLYTVGWIAETERNGERAVAAAAQAIDLARQAPVDERLLGMALNLQGLAMWTAHDNAGSAKSFREALDIHRRVLGAEDMLTLADEEGIASALLNSGEYVQAAEYFRQAHEGFGHVYGPANMRTLNVAQGLALDEFQIGRYADARRDFEQVLQTLKENPLQNDAFQSEILMNHGLVLAELGDLDGAEREISEARDALAKHYDNKFAAIVEADGDLGYVHTGAGKLELAEQELRETIAAKEEAKDDDRTTELARLSDVRRLRGDASEASSVAQQALENALKLYGEHSLQAARAHDSLGLALLAAHHDDEAQKELRASLASFALIVPPDGMHPGSSGPRLALGRMLAAQPDHAAESLALLRQALKLRSDVFGADSAAASEVRTAIAQAHPGTQVP